MTSSETDATKEAAAARWALVTARDIMRKDVVTVNYATPLSDVERRLSDHRISGAPVTDESGHIIGVISLKDLVERYAESFESHPRRGYRATAQSCLYQTSPPAALVNASSIALGAHMMLKKVAPVSLWIIGRCGQLMAMRKRAYRA